MGDDVHLEHPLVHLCHNGDIYKEELHHNCSLIGYKPKLLSLLFPFSNFVNQITTSIQGNIANLAKKQTTSCYKFKTMSKPDSTILLNSKIKQLPMVQHPLRFLLLCFQQPWIEAKSQKLILFTRLKMKMTNKRACPTVCLQHHQ